MKTLKTAALLLGTCLLLAPPAPAGGFLDVYGGFSKFGDFNGTSSFVYPQTANPTEHNFAYPGSKVLDSYAAGFRVGGISQSPRVNYALAYDMEFYGVNALVGGNLESPHNSSLSHLVYEPEGGMVVQPGIQFLLGLPLRYVRAYAGYGLIFPIMFYDYSSFDAHGNTITVGKSGTSGSVGHQFVLGGRWIISKRFNLLVEDRIQQLFTPLVIKDSFYDKNNVVGNGSNLFYDSSFTFKNLKANQVLIGLGFAWGN